jgi:hypothetical protein
MLPSVLMLLGFAAGQAASTAIAGDVWRGTVYTSRTPAGPVKTSRAPTATAYHSRTPTATVER